MWRGSATSRRSRDWGKEHCGPAFTRAGAVFNLIARNFYCLKLIVCFWVLHESLISRPESEGGYCWVAACSGDRLHPGEVETGVKSIAGLLSPVPGRCSVFQSYCKDFLLPQTYRCFGASFKRDLSRPESEGSWVVVYSGDRLHYIQENRCWLVTPRLERGSGSQVRFEHPNHLICTPSRGGPPGHQKKRKGERKSRGRHKFRMLTLSFFVIHHFKIFPGVPPSWGYLFGKHALMTQLTHTNGRTYQIHPTGTRTSYPRLPRGPLDT